MQSSSSGCHTTGAANGPSYSSSSNDGHLKLESKLKKLLKKHFGSTKNKEVLRTIDELTPHNPTPEPTKSPLLIGDFICHTLPEFPGRIKTENKEIIQYTLGRLSFGIFAPHSLVCTIRSVRQSVRLRLESKTGKFKTYEYPIMMDLTIHTPCGQDLPAIVSHDAICYECPQQPHRMKVTFKGSTLVPSRQVLLDPSLLQVWMDTFEGAYEKAAAQRNLISRTLRSMMAWWFQMTLPSDEEMQSTRNHSVHFEMKRSPRGHLDVLYMSDTTRITKGNRGTLVVVEPLDCTGEDGDASANSLREGEDLPELVGEEHQV
jgi:hypothetical protein